jgi:acyl-CoA synthetase (AMP-forming)/AMP-acid ligase II
MPTSLRRAWERTVRAQPGAVALVDAATGREWTRSELAALGLDWARVHGGQVARRRVVFAEPNGAAWLQVFLGLVESDAVIVALDPGEPPAAQRNVAAAVNAAFLWREGGLEQIGPLRRTRVSGTRLLKLTSGSTGVPRALPFTDAQLLADGRQVCATMAIRAKDVNLGCIPFGHSYGLGNLILPLLRQGTRIVSGAPLLPQGLAEAIALWCPTVFPAVPALLRAMASAEIPAAQLRSLRTVISAGSPLSPEVATEFFHKFGRKIHNFYGSSETGGITYDRTGDAALTGRSVGRPMLGVKLSFGAGRRFRVASAAVTGKGRFRPADRGELNARGELVLLGRAGRMLKIAGRRLDPGEVERALRQLAGVQEAHVAPHGTRADALAAVVASRATGSELREQLRDRLAAWKIPKKIVVVPQFPLTARGKPDLRRLRALLAD